MVLNSIKFTTLINAITYPFKKNRTEYKSEDIANESTKLEDLEMFADMIIESSDDTDDMYDNYGESVGTEEGLDLDQYFNEMCDELFAESDNDETDDLSTDVDDYVYNEEDELFTDDESDTEIETESADNEVSDTDLYMEQLERELFGDDESVVEESVETSISSLLDEMESLLD